MQGCPRQLTVKAGGRMEKVTVQAASTVFVVKKKNVFCVSETRTISINQNTNVGNKSKRE